MSVNSFLRSFSGQNKHPLLPITSTPLSNITSYTTARSFQSTYSVSEMITSTDSDQQDTFLALARESDHLQQSLQTLIDAQSEGLLAGFADTQSQQEHEATSSGSRTPTTSASIGYSSTNVQNSAPVTPVRQPAKRKIGLQGARQGISRTIDKLAVVKIQEGQLLATAVRDKEQEINTTKALAQKQIKLEEQIRRIDEEDIEAPRQGSGLGRGRKRDKLEAEERALAEEIRETEAKLWTLQAQHRQLRTEIDTLDNSVQAKLSSYHAALALAETEARDFLRREDPKTSRQRPSRNGQSLWALPADRRTLGMAEEQFREEAETLRRREVGVETERKALEEGAQVWRDVVERVTGVEALLRAEMSPDPSTSYPSTTAAVAVNSSPRSILRSMHAAAEALEEHVEQAERKGWSLLVCTVGAELEALREGCRVLEGVVGVGEEGDGTDGRGNWEEGDGADGRGNWEDGRVDGKGDWGREDGNRDGRKSSELVGGNHHHRRHHEEEPDSQDGAEDEDEEEENAYGDAPGMDLLLEK